MQLFEQLKQKETVWAVLSVLFGTLSVLVIVTIIGGILMLLGVFGQEPYPTKTITVSGEGKVTAVPDLAVVSFTVREETKDVSGAQDQNSTKGNAVLAKIKALGIEEKDLKMTYYNIAPRYEYRKIDPVCVGYVCDQTQIVTGYTVTQTVQVKVRNTENIGKVLAVLGEEKVTDFNGPNLQIDDDADLQNEAKLLAIADARAKAKEIAKGLNVRLGKLTNYYEDTGPVAYGGEMMAMDTAVPMVRGKIAPDVPIGEDDITARVTLTYQIR